MEISLDIVPTDGAWLNDVTYNRNLTASRFIWMRNWIEIQTERSSPTPGPFLNMECYWKDSLKERKSTNRSLNSGHNLFLEETK